MINFRSIPIFILSIMLLVALYMPFESTAAPLIIDETFDSAIPAGWTQVQYSSTGLWQWSDDTITNYPPLNYDGGFLSADSDSNIGIYYDVGLFTTSMDMSGLTSVQIAFDKNFQVIGGGDTASVSTYSGGTGMANFEEELGFWNVDDLIEGEHVSYIIDPSTYDDASDVYVEFWYSSGDGDWEWSFSIDNLQIGEPPLSVILSVDDIDHCAGTVDVTATATGGTTPYLYYDWDFDGDGVYEGWHTTGNTYTIPVDYGYSGQIGVRVTDSALSTATDQGTVSTNPQIAVSLSVEYDPGMAIFTATPSGGDGSYAYDWDLDGDCTYEIVSTSSNTQTLMSPGASGTAYVRATDTEGCAATDFVDYEIKSSWSPAVLKPLVSTMLIKANSTWECLLQNLPEEVSEDVQTMLGDVQSHMENAATLSNPVYANGELNSAISLMEQINVILDCECYPD